MDSNLRSRFKRNGRREASQPNAGNSREGLRLIHRPADRSGIPSAIPLVDPRPFSGSKRRVLDCWLSPSNVINTGCCSTNARLRGVSIGAYPNPTPVRAVPSGGSTLQPSPGLAELGGLS